MQKITDILKRKEFTISAEIFPPRNGSNPLSMIDTIMSLADVGVDFLSITKGALGSSRGGTAAFTHLAHLNFGLNVIAHFTCREYTPQEIENMLVDHMLLGVKNILALRGDPPAGKDESYWSDHKQTYRYAYQLIRQIKDMNKGKYLRYKDKDGNDKKGFKSDFCVGVAAHPEAEDQEKEAEYLKIKQEAGAEFAITQMFFDAQEYFDYVDRVRKAGVTMPILPGLKPILNKRSADFVENRIGILVPQDIKDCLEDDETAKELAMRKFLDLCEKLKEGGVPGIHLFILNKVDVAEEIVDELLKRKIIIR